MNNEALVGLYFDDKRFKNDFLCAYNYYGALNKG